MSSDPKSLHRINVLEGIMQESLAYTAPYRPGGEAHYALKSKRFQRGDFRVIRRTIFLLPKRIFQKTDLFSSARFKIKVQNLGSHTLKKMQG